MKIFKAISWVAAFLFLMLLHSTAFTTLVVMLNAPSTFSFLFGAFVLTLATLIYGWFYYLIIKQIIKIFKNK